MTSKQKWISGKHSRLRIVQAHNQPLEKLCVQLNIGSSIKEFPQKPVLNWGLSFFNDIEVYWSWEKKASWALVSKKKKQFEDWSIKKPRKIHGLYPPLNASSCLSYRRRCTGWSYIWCFLRTAFCFNVASSDTVGQIRCTHNRVKCEPLICIPIYSI